MAELFYGPAGWIERDGWVLRWGPGWQLSYPVGATIQVELIDDTDEEPTDGC